MVGNDVVDLGDRETQPGSLHPRFDQRVFTTDEQQLIATDRCSNRLRWMLWASKESAYKLVKRENPSIVFSPRAFEVVLQRARMSHQPPAAVKTGETCGLAGIAQVHHQGHAVCVEIRQHGDAIHAVATRSWDRITKLISAVGTTGPYPSSTVRDLARHHLAPMLEATPDELEVVSGPDRIPALRIGRERLPGFMSLSHHGRFVAFSYAQILDLL